MMAVGVVLCIIGGLLDIVILWVVGIVLVIVGGILWLLGSTDHQVGPRKHYW